MPVESATLSAPTVIVHFDTNWAGEYNSLACDGKNFYLLDADDGGGEADLEIAQEVSAKDALLWYSSGTRYSAASSGCPEVLFNVVANLLPD